MLPSNIKQHIDNIIAETKQLQDIIIDEGYTAESINILDEAILGAVYQMHKEEAPHDENNMYEKIAYTKKVRGYTIHEKA